MPARTSPTLLPPSLALCCHYPVSKYCSASIVVTSTVRVNVCFLCLFTVYAPVLDATEQQWTESDNRHSAIGLGIAGIIFVISMGVFFILLDVDLYILHLKHLAWVNVFGKPKI